MLKTAAGNNTVLLKIHKIQAHKVPRKTERIFPS